MHARSVHGIYVRNVHPLISALLHWLSVCNWWAWLFWMQGRKYMYLAGWVYTKICAGIPPLQVFFVRELTTFLRDSRNPAANANPVFDASVNTASNFWVNLNVMFKGYNLVSIQIFFVFNLADFQYLFAFQFIIVKTHPIKLPSLSCALQPSMCLLDRNLKCFNLNLVCSVLWQAIKCIHTHFVLKLYIPLCQRHQKIGLMFYLLNDLF